MGKIEDGVKVVDQAARADSLPVVRAEQRPEDEDNVIIPYYWDPFHTGRSLAPNGDLCESWSFSTH